MIQWKDKRIEDETLELERGESYSFGPSLELVRCTVIVKTDGGSLSFKNTRFVDCRIETPSELSGAYWVDAFLGGCSFSGRFSDSDFGHWPDAYDPDGGIENADFSAATLDGCRFIGCDASTIVFPRWPCFTILDPVRRLDELQASDWPGDADIIVETIADFPPETTAVTYVADWVERELDAVPDELRAVLERLGGVVM